MSDREGLLRTFLNVSNWGDARMAPLAGDASNRRYLRLTRVDTGAKAVLMDAPPEKNEDVRPFLRIARYLSDVGLSAPKILSEDDDHGFLLLEDLGDALFARVLENSPVRESELYTAATDLLISLHEHAPPSGLETYDADRMTGMAALALDWYAAGSGPPRADKRQEFHRRFRKILAENVPEARVLIQRDYHAENLLWLPDRSGVARVGLLDFQDAMLGHPAYDLVSLLQDARRDVSPSIERQMISRYVSFTGTDYDAFTTAYKCLGAQRNLRIIGVFARLCLRDGKPGYLKFLPRVWGYLKRDLDHPALSPIVDVLKLVLPEPTNDVLNLLEEKCQTVPAQ